MKAIPLIWISLLVAACQSSPQASDIYEDLLTQKRFRIDSVASGDQLWLYYKLAVDSAVHLRKSRVALLIEACQENIDRCDQEIKDILASFRGLGAEHESLQQAKEKRRFYEQLKDSMPFRYQDVINHLTQSLDKVDKNSDYYVSEDFLRVDPSTFKQLALFERYLPLRLLSDGNRYEKVN
jgi:hypothetical protein